MSKKIFWSFTRARLYIHTCKINTKREWDSYVKTSKRSIHIPVDPSHIYVSEWKGWGDWLGSYKRNRSNRKFLSFIEAKKYVKKLNFTSHKEWIEWKAAQKKPPYIPSNPKNYYKNEWKGWANWLGQTATTNKRNRYLTFHKAKKYIQGMAIKSRNEWRAWVKSSAKPNYIPSAPNTIYKMDWKGWGDWFGRDRISNSKRVFVEFSEAEIIVKTLKLKSKNEWLKWIKTNNRKINIPSAPRDNYKKQRVGTRPKFLTFKEAKELVIKLNLQSRREWQAFTKSKKRILNIPSAPDLFYNAEWLGWIDWLGKKIPIKDTNRYMTFSEAKSYLKSLSLKSKYDFLGWIESVNRLDSIPTDPQKVYAKEWHGWGDFLGFEPKNLPRPFRPFIEAKDYVQKLGLKSQYEWNAWVKNAEKPRDIPAAPHIVYKLDWQGLGDWLGTKMIATFNREYLTFAEAKLHVKTLKLKSVVEWKIWVKNGNKPDNIPSNPQVVYKKYWKSWHNWLAIRKKIRNKLG